MQENKNKQYISQDAKQLLTFYSYLFSCDSVVFRFLSVSSMCL